MSTVSRKPVAVNVNGVYYPSVSAAAEKTGLSRWQVQKAAAPDPNGRCPNCGKTGQVLSQFPWSTMPQPVERRGRWECETCIETYTDLAYRKSSRPIDLSQFVPAMTLDEWIRVAWKTGGACSQCGHTNLDAEGPHGYTVVDGQFRHVDCSRFSFETAAASATVPMWWLGDGKEADEGYDAD